MNVETIIAKNIRIADMNAKYDAACKRLLSEKIILAWIMKSCLEEYKDFDVNEIAERYIEGTPQVAEVAVLPDETNVTLIKGINTEDSSLTEGIITYDIRFEAIVPQSNEYIRLIVNVEAQNDFYPGYPLVKRSLYYCSRMISAQCGTEFVDSHYEKIKKVYSIWICPNPPKKWENSITRYAIKEENLVGMVKDKKANYDLMSVIMVYLGSEQHDNYNGVLKLLNVLLSTKTNVQEKKQILEEDFQIQMTQKLESEVSVMCNLSKGVMEQALEEGLAKGIAEGLARGIEEGLAKGMAKGIEEGLAKGIEEERKNSIISVMKNMKLSLEEAMSVLNIPKAKNRDPQTPREQNGRHGTRTARTPAPRR